MEEAALKAAAEAGKTLTGIRSAYIQDHSALVEHGKITEYRLTAKLSFELNHKGKK